ncbi:hypothetical protein EAVVTKC53_00928 [Elizabethkingia anophelis]|nr:hypothetical protein EAVVTKC53_01797 [Elizabethkingia anophelis]CAI9679230.1 hypothetical protein EAVVTKC53_00928 [Elizabethkingia anophelis]
MNNLNANYERILEVLREISNENLVSLSETNSQTKGFGID